MDPKPLLASILGFFFIEKELNKVFKFIDQIESLALDSFRKIEKYIKTLYQRLTPNEILVLRKDLSYFSTGLNKLGMT